MTLGALFREGNVVQVVDDIFVSVYLPIMEVGRFRVKCFWSSSRHFLRSPTALSCELVGVQYWSKGNKLLFTRHAAIWKTHDCLDLLAVGIVYCGLN